MALLNMDGSPTHRTQINKYEVTESGIQKTSSQNNKIELRANSPKGGDAKPRDQGVFGRYDCLAVKTA